MPFIEQWRRVVIGAYGLEGLAEIQPGDRCYVYYQAMVDRWKAEPRWTTAHNIFKDMIMSLGSNDDDGAAAFLAWQVFFQLYVMPYELKKREENGDI